MKSYKIPALAVATLISVVTISAYAKSENSAKSGSEKHVLTEVVSRGSIENVGQYTGIVKGEQETRLSPKTSGIITSLLKKEGEAVRKGELLATLDGSELYAESSLSQENISIAKKSLEKTTDYYNQLVDEAEASLEKASKLYKITREGAERAETDLAKRDLDKSKEALKSAKKLRDLQINIASGQLNISQEKNAVTSSQLNNVRLVAPYSGTITALNSQLGALVGPGISIYSLSSSAKKQLEISIPAAEALKLSVGQKIALFSENNISAEGTIFSISPLADFESRKSNIKISVPSEMSLGTYIRADILLERKNEAIVVPTEAIIKKYHEDFVYVVEEGKAVQKIVSTGLSEKGRIEISSGLTEGEIIIKSGHHYLRNGDTVISTN